MTTSSSAPAPRRGAGCCGAAGSHRNGQAKLGLLAGGKLVLTSSRRWAYPCAAARARRRRRRRADPAASGASRYIPELARLFNKSPSTVGGTLALLNATFVLASPFVPKVVARLGEDRVSAGVRGAHTHALMGVRAAPVATACTPAAYARTQARTQGH